MNRALYKLKKDLRGGSLIELLCALALFFVITLTALPNFQSFLASYRNRAVLASIAHTLHEAKSLAQLKNSRLIITLTPSPAGMQVGRDTPPFNTALVADEELFKTPLPARYTLGGPAVLVVTSRGDIGTTLANTPAPLSITLARNGERVGVVSLTSGGVISTEH